jgi:hypothetical protein
MKTKCLTLGLLAGLALTSLASAVPTAASAHPLHHGFGLHAHYWGGGYWRAAYRLPRYWVRGVVLQNGCPIGYVRDGGLCYPAF